MPTMSLTGAAVTPGHFTSDGRLIEVVLPQFVVERRARDAEDFGGAAEIALGAFEHTPDVEAFEFIERKEIFTGVFVSGRAAQRQVACANAVAAAQEHRAFDDVAQLADVAGPVVTEQQSLGLRRHTLDAAVEPLIEVADEMSDERQYVLAAFAQRRQRDRHYVQAVEEVFAEAPAFDLVLQVAVCRGDDPHGDLFLLHAADAPEPFLFEDVEQPRLNRRLHLRNFVEEDRALMRQLEQPGLAGDRASVRALLVAEEFRNVCAGVAELRRVEGVEKLEAEFE